MKAITLSLLFSSACAAIFVRSGVDPAAGRDGTVAVGSKPIIAPTRTAAEQVPEMILDGAILNEMESSAPDVEFRHRVRASVLASGSPLHRTFRGPNLVQNIGVVDGKGDVPTRISRYPEITEHIPLNGEQEDATQFFAPSRKALAVENHERDPVTGQWRQYLLKFGASFTIVDFQHRCANDFILLGEGESGEPIVERWVLSMPKGAWMAFRPQHSAGIVGQDNYGVLQAAIQGGGSFVPVHERDDFPFMRRFRIDLGNETKAITALHVDPDARFVMVAFDNGEVSQIDIQSGVRTPIFDSSTTNLDGVVGVLQPMWSSTHGRIFSARGEDYFPFINLFDADNDGVFEGFYESSSYQEHVDVMGLDALPVLRF